MKQEEEGVAAHMGKLSKEEKHNRQFPTANWKNASTVWDCGSTLYDSYELNSLKRQIDSAIANSPRRSLSMSHLPERRRLPLQPNHTQPSPSSKTFKIPRPFQKLLRFVFNKSSNKSKINSTTTNNSNSGSSSNNLQMAAEKYTKERLYVVYDKYSDQPVLSTIPELPEFEIAGGGGLSPEIGSLVRKSASERFAPPTAIGISCA